MRTETISRTLYTAAELREQHPDGFRRAHERHIRWVCEDPAWAEETRQSMAAALAACGETPPDISGTRRVMAWAENQVFGPLRLPFGKIANRKALAQWGAFYRPGLVKPCPWTGYCHDEDYLDLIRQEAREGTSPADIKRAIEALAERLWDDEMTDQCSESYFLGDAEANEREFLANGELV